MEKTESKQLTKTELTDDSLNYSALTDKNKLFIEYLLSGKYSVTDCHLKAGYTGNVSASYELRNRLKPFIQELSGLNQIEIFKELRELSNLKVREVENNLEIDAELKLKIIDRKAKLLKMDESTSKPKVITPFVINVNGTVKTNNPIVDTKVIKE